ncbi:MAG: DUF58 domain-containing protein [Bacillota bacterium]|nr:DUF58 domain-containing protein [Bacillota bacterium]
MKKVLDEAFLKLVRSLNLNLSVKLKNNKLGKKHSSDKGSSVEFSDYRAYSPGDDYRRIDWSALARFEKMFLKLYMEEQQASISIFVDTSKSMEQEKKREAEIKLAALFALSSLNEYDKVSLLFFDEVLHDEVRNVNGKQGFYRIADALESKSYASSGKLLDAVKQAAPKLKKGCSILITDLLYPHHLDEVLKLLNYRKQKVILCHVLAKEELAVSFPGNVRLKDSETGQEINIDWNDGTAKLYEERLQAFLKEAQGICKAHNASYFLINADEGIESLIHHLKKLS